MRTAKVGPEQYDAIVRLFRTGLNAARVASAVGLGRSGLYDLLRRDPDLKARVREAQAAYREANRHGTEGCYTNAGCRLPECTAAASEARARRRAAKERDAAVIALPAPPPRRPSAYELAGPPPARYADTA